MSVQEKFGKMPLGVKLLFLFFALGFLGNLLNLPASLQISFSKPVHALYFQITLALGLIITALLVHGIWNAKKYVEKLFWLALIIGILNALALWFVLPGFYDDFFAPSFQKVAANPILLSSGFKSLFIGLMQIMIPVGFAVTLVILWYVRKKKDYFKN